MAQATNTLSKRVERLEKWAFGNGTPGADELLRSIDAKLESIVNSVKPAESDTRQILNALRKVYGARIDIEDDKAQPDKFGKLLHWFVDKILPSVVIALIMGGVGWLAAVNGLLGGG